MIPKLLFRDIFVGSAGDTNNACPRCQLLFLTGILRINCGIADKTRDQIYLGDIRAPGQRAGEVDDVFCLSTGIRVAAELQSLAPNEAVNAQQAYVQATSAVVYL